MRTPKPYWQTYWYELHFRDEREHSFTPLGPGPLRQVPNTMPVTAFADWILAQGVDELDDLRGELRVQIHTEPDPRPDAVPAVTRTIELTGPGMGIT